MKRPFFTTADAGGGEPDQTSQEQEQVTTETQLDEVVSDEQQPEQPPQKLFTQEEVDRFIGKRVGKIERKYEARIQEIETRLKSQPTGPEKTPDDFETTEEFIEHKSSLLAEKKAQEKMVALREQEHIANIRQAFQTKAEAFAEKHEDYEDVISGISLSQVMVEGIVESDIGPEISYYLGSNRKETERILKLTPLQQIKELGKIEDKLASGALTFKKHSAAPDPILPGKGSGSSAPRIADSSKMSVQDYERLRNQQEREFLKKERGL